MTRSMFQILAIITFSAICCAQPVYKLVNGIPYNSEAKSDPAYPYCPVSSDIEPCTCQQLPADYLPTFECIGIDTDKLVAAFDKLFPTYLARSITVRNSNLTNIPANVFGDKSPAAIMVLNSNVETIDDDAFTATLQVTSRGLESLEITGNPKLREFPFASLSVHSGLTNLVFNENNLQGLTGIGEMSLPVLENFEINLNPAVGTLPGLSALPRLKRFAASSSGIKSISSQKPFYELKEIESLDLSNNPLGRVTSLTFSFDEGSAVANINLTGCSIADIESNAFIGIRTNTTILLVDNLLTSLPTDVFKPVLQALTSGDGEGLLDLTGNSITCCCDINWLISDSAFLDKIRGGQCAGGADFNILPLEYLKPLCPPL